MSEERTSYRLGEATYADVEAELARLRAQADVAWPQEREALRQHGLAPAADVLEAGCGPGFVTGRLLELVPEGSVTALDSDPRMVEFARAGFGDHDRVAIVQASATATQLPSRSFDVVIARFLLQHLPNPAAAVDEFRRVLRPGGRLIAIDADDAFAIMLDPEPEFVHQVTAAVGELQRLQGGDRMIGRRLPGLFASRGFTDLAFGAVLAHSVVVGFEAIRRVLPDQALDALEAAGLLAADAAAAARDLLRAADAGEVELAAVLGYVVASGSAPGA